MGDLSRAITTNTFSVPCTLFPQGHSLEGGGLNFRGSHYPRELSPPGVFTLLSKKGENGKLLFKDFDLEGELKELSDAVSFPVGNLHLGKGLFWGLGIFTFIGLFWLAAIYIRNIVVHGQDGLFDLGGSGFFELTIFLVFTYVLYKGRPSPQNINQQRAYVRGLHEQSTERIISMAQTLSAMEMVEGDQRTGVVVDTGNRTVRLKRGGIVLLTGTLNADEASLRFELPPRAQRPFPALPLAVGEHPS